MRLVFAASLRPLLSGGMPLLVCAASCRAEQRCGERHSKLYTCLVVARRSVGAKRRPVEKLEQVHKGAARSGG